MPVEDTEITELESFEPTRVDGVGKGANGFPILMLKAVGDSIEETDVEVDEVLSILDKADREDCDSCSGSGKMDDKKCSKCFGSGVKPMPGDTEKSLKEIAAIKEAGVAASGQPVPLAHDCPTCNGGGNIADGTAEGKTCPDCDGSGRDGQYNTGEIREGFGGSISEGDPQGREKIDKSVEFCEDEECDVCKTFLADGDEDSLEKKRLKYKERQALGDSAFALPGRRYPIHDASHARNALARVAQNGSPEEKAKVRAAVRRRYPDIDVGGDDAEKADGSMFTGPNPQLAAMATKVGDAITGTDDCVETGPAPGSPEWEGIDAATATEAAVALMAASEKIREFAQRESIEVAAGEGNDIFDTFASEQALCDVSHALGIMAQMAFHEGLEAAKSADDVEKAGRRLSSQTKSALVELRTHLTNLLGDDDPAKATDDEASKAVAFDMAELAKELEEMTTDELTKVLDARDEKLVGSFTEALQGVLGSKKAKKGKSATDEATSVAHAKVNHDHGNAAGDAAVDEDDDLEDEATQGTNESASGTRDATGGAKALTDEEIEANEAAKAAKLEAKRLKKAAEDAAERAQMAKAIEEATAEVRKANAVLEERLAKVEQMAAPSDIVRTRPTEALKASAERDSIELELTRWERMSKEATNPEMRTEYMTRAKDARQRLAALTSS